MVRHFQKILVFAILAVVGLRVAWAQRNLALHKPVQMSSVLLGSPDGVVNGAVEWGLYAVHSRSGSTWLTIDLGDAYPIGAVRIFGRGDGFHTDSSSPMVVAVSGDGKGFSKPFRCSSTVNTQVNPCVMDLVGTRGRFVRVSHPTHLVLSEVEVFRAP